jgi:hypothetical protein
MRIVTIISFDELQAYREYLRDLNMFAETLQASASEEVSVADMEYVLEQLFAPRKKAIWEGLAKKYSLDLNRKLFINLQNGSIFIE